MPSVCTGDGEDFEGFCTFQLRRVVLDLHVARIFCFLARLSIVHLRFRMRQWIGAALLFSRVEKMSWTPFLCVVLCAAMLAGCGGRQSGESSPSSETADSAKEEEVPETVGEPLVAEIDRLIAQEDHTALQELGQDLREQVALLAFFRSSRAPSLSEQLQRIERALAAPLQESDDPDDTWGGAQLLAWVQALQAWELEGTPDLAAFEGLGCADVVGESQQYQEFGECVLRAIDAHVTQAQESFSALQRASMGDLSARTRTWLSQRALPLTEIEVGDAEDVGLSLARAWTGLASDDDAFLVEGAMVVLRIQGVRVAYRPSVFGEAVFEEGLSDRCTWPGEDVLAFASGGIRPTDDVLQDGLAAMREAYDVCAKIGPDFAQDRANVAIDAGVKWNAIAPVLRELMAMHRRPRLLVRDVQEGALSGLPVSLAHKPQSGVCGVEAHLRRDGVVLRGGGAPMHLVSWTDRDAFVQLTEQAKQVVERCEAQPTVQVVLDEDTVDWGLVVRVLERMSWPQVCAEETPCMESVLVVGR